MIVILVVVVVVVLVVVVIGILVVVVALVTVESNLEMPTKTADHKPQSLAFPSYHNLFK